MEATKREAAEYLRELSAEMKTIAAVHGLDDVAFIFGMAELGSEQAINEEAPEKTAAPIETVHS